MYQVFCFLQVSDEDDVVHHGKSHEKTQLMRSSQQPAIQLPTKRRSVDSTYMLGTAVLTGCMRDMGLSSLITYTHACHAPAIMLISRHHQSSIDSVYSNCHCSLYLGSPLPYSAGPVRNSINSDGGVCLSCIIYARWPRQCT